MDNKSNILILVADQLRYDCVGEAHKSPAVTPNIDELAQNGVFFENAYTSIPTCCPARQSFYACKRSESFGSYWNDDITYPNPGLPVSEYSFVRDFQSAGYETVHVGRGELNLEHDVTEYGYNTQIDTWKDYNKNTEPSKRKPESCGYLGWVDGDDEDTTPTGYTAVKAIDEIKTLCENKEKPFFMTVCFSSPHPPYRPQKRFADMYENVPKWGSFDENFTNKPYIQFQQLRNWGIESRTWEEWEPVVRKYYGQVSEIDCGMGRIIDALKESGEYDNTTIVITSDHGDMCGAHRMFDKHYVLYEDVTHVPLIIKAAKSLENDAGFKGRTKEYTVHNLDLGPTLMDLCKITPSCSATHGKSMKTVLNGGKSERNEAVSSFNGAQFGLYTSRSIKTDSWKYIWNPTDIDELYNLDSDPDELVNLIGDESCEQKITELRGRLLNILLEEGDPFCTVGRTWAARRQLEENRKNI